MLLSPALNCRNLSPRSHNNLLGPRLELSSSSGPRCPENTWENCSHRRRSCMWRWPHSRVARRLRRCAGFNAVRSSDLNRSSLCLKSEKTATQDSSGSPIVAILRVVPIPYGNKSPSRSKGLRTFELSPNAVPQVQGGLHRDHDHADISRTITFGSSHPIARIDRGRIGILRLRHFCVLR